jgi:hypothetical protein
MVASYPMGTRSSFSGVKRPGREADHLPPSSAEAKECVELYIYSSNTPHGVVLSSKKKAKGQLYLNFYVIKVYSLFETSQRIGTRTSQSV